MDKIASTGTASTELVRAGGRLAPNVRARARTPRRLSPTSTVARRTYGDRLPVPAATSTGEVGTVLQYAKPLSAPVAGTSRDWAKGALYGVLGAVATCAMLASLLLGYGTGEYRATGVALLAAAALLTVVGVGLAVASGRKVNSVVTSGNVAKEIR